MTHRTRRSRIAVRRSLGLVAAATVFSMGWTGIAHAQLSFPDVSVDATGKSVIPVSAAEAVYHTQVQDAKNFAAMSYRVQTPKSVKDSLEKISQSVGEQWLATVRAHQVRGLQLDAAGGLAIAVNEEAYAKQAIDTRLASPNLSLADRAHTLMKAVQAFAWSPDTSTQIRRVAIAKAYLKTLDALGDAALVEQYRARRHLIGGYYTGGQTEDLIRTGEEAMQLVARMPFPERAVFFFEFEGNRPFFLLCEALAGQKDGQARIAKVSALIQAAAVPPASLIAVEKGFIPIGEEWGSRMRLFVASVQMLGAKAEPIVSNYWLNMPTRDSQVVALNTGKIHVFQISTRDCVACIAQYFQMQQVHEAMPEVGVMLVTHTLGYWSNRLVSPEEEAERLADYYLKDAKLTYPIAIWKPKVIVNPEDGGMVNDNSGPNEAHYPYASKPMVWMVDGNGTIRRVYNGMAAANTIIESLKYLQAEAARAGAVKHASENRPTPDAVAVKQ